MQHLLNTDIMVDWGSGHQLAFGHSFKYFVLYCMIFYVLELTVSTADEVQARYRKSLPVVSGYSPSSSPAARRRLLPDDNGRHGDHGRHGDDGTPASPHPADTKRRRFSRAASMAFRKSIDGTHHDAQEELDADRLRSLLAKTSAANVGSIVDCWVICR